MSMIDDTKTKSGKVEKWKSDDDANIFPPKKKCILFASSFWRGEKEGFQF